MSNDRYRTDWNEYSSSWETGAGAGYRHLGDEWNDDGTPDRRRDQHYFRTHVERWIRPDCTALEVGPGGGKWTVQMAPRIKKLFVLDVAEAMLQRTRKRCEAAGIRNVEYVHGSGDDFKPIADESIDFFFSFDVFVHIALEDTFAYVDEMARVLRPGGIGACHHAIATSPEAWNKIDRENFWFRGGAHTLGQFYYYSPEALRRMYERAGLFVLEEHHEQYHCTVTFEKPAAQVSVVPRFEAALRRLRSAPPGAEAVARAAADLETLERELAAGTRAQLQALEQETDPTRRSAGIQRLRRLWRGL